MAPLIAKEDQAVKADPKMLRTLRYTAWSEPTAPVRLKCRPNVLAGDVEFDGPKKVQKSMKTGSVSMTVKEPKGVVVATIMDWNTGT